MLLSSVQRSPLPWAKEETIDLVRLALNWIKNMENGVKLHLSVVSRAPAKVLYSMKVETKEDHSELTCDCLGDSSQPLGLGEA